MLAKAGPGIRFNEHMEGDPTVFAHACKLGLEGIVSKRNDEDYDVLADGAVVGRIFQVHAPPVGMPWMWTLAFGHHEDRPPTHGYEPTREAAMRRSRRVGGGSSGDDKPSQRVDTAACAGLGHRVHHPVGRSGGDIRPCPYSLVASRTTTGHAKRLPAIPILASAMQGARLHTSLTRRSDFPFRGQTGKHLLVLGLTGFDPKPTWSRPTTIGFQLRPLASL